MGETTDEAARIRELEAEVSRLRTMLAGAPNFIARITTEGRFLYMNRLSPGFTMEQVLGSSVMDYTPPEFQEVARSAIEAAIASRKIQRYETIGPLSQDTMGHYVTHVGPVEESGEITSLVMVATDVTELREALRELAESRARLQVALDASGLGIWTYDRDSGGTWDATVRQIFGIPAHSGQGTGEESGPTLQAMLTERVHPDDRARVATAVDTAIETGVYPHIEHRVVWPDGTIRWVAASGKLLPSDNGTGRRLVGGVVDITERRALEAQLRESHRLESIGRLAGGIAHDFNNLLTAVLGNVQLVLGQTGSSSSLRPLLEEIRVAAERSADLTAQLLAFARRHMVEPQVVDLNMLVRRVEGLLRRVIGEPIELSVSLEAKGKILVDPSQAEQVLLNLATNARDAMPEGGRLTIETRDVEVVPAEEPGEAIPAEPRAHIRLRVTDTGKGIAPEHLPHIFEPFFSTREQGTGLGLATTYGIVKQGGGSIRATSAGTGAGATFEVFFPTVDLPVVPRPAEASGPKPEAPRGAVVLLVEDEAMVRRLLQRTLESEGYVVHPMSSGEEALRALPELGSIDIVVTDIVMPRMDGHELAVRVAEQRPDVVVLFISGYTDDENIRTHVLSRHAFLQKPFVPADFLTAIGALRWANHPVLPTRTPSRFEPS